MITINVDGDETEQFFDRRLTTDEVRNFVGGPWKIEGVIVRGKKKYSVLALARGWRTEDVNHPAGLLVGRMIYGPVVLLEKGVEIA